MEKLRRPNAQQRLLRRISGAENTLLSAENAFLDLAERTREDSSIKDVKKVK